MNFRTMMQSGPAKANELFGRLAETSDGAVKTRERLFAELKAELELHASLEEQHLFPILRKNAETKELVADAIRDNRELRASLAALDALPKNDPGFAEQLAELQKAFRQHARDEKKELLPAVQRALSEEQVQDVTERMEAGVAEAEQARQEDAEQRRAKARQEREEAEAAAREAEQARQEEAEQRRAKARQEREEAEFVARQAELRSRQMAEAEREQNAAAQRARAEAERMADAALKPLAAATRAAGEVTRLVAGASDAEARRRSQAQAAALTNMFMWPWLGATQALQRPGSGAAARGAAGTEEVIPLGEEVLEVGKRTENRGTARIHRYVVETPVERQVTLLSERVVVERRRPATDKVTGEVLTEVTVEVVETEEVPTVGKRLRVREEVVVRTERTERVATVAETVRRDEVEVEQGGQVRSQRQPRAAMAGR